MLKEMPAGRQVTLVISRDGQQRTIQTQLANREEVERQAWGEALHCARAFGQLLGLCSSHRKLLSRSVQACSGERHS